MKTYDGWIDRVLGPVVRVTSHEGSYWLPRRSDLLAWEATEEVVSDLEARRLWLLAVDLLADCTGQADMAVRAAPDLAQQLSLDGQKREWLIFQEWLFDFVVAWVCRQVGLLPFGPGGDHDR